MVEDTLVAAQAPRAAERAGRYTVELFFRRERRVGVPRAPFGVFREGLDDGEFGGSFVDVGCLGDVFGGPCEGEGGRDDDQSDVLACEAADEEEERGVDVGAERACGAWWGRMGRLW
jgi:hypothetical protein